MGFYYEAKPQCEVVMSWKSYVLKYTSIHYKSYSFFSLAKNHRNENFKYLNTLKQKRLAFASRLLITTIYLRPSRRNAEEVKLTSFKSAEKSYIFASLSKPIAI